MENFDDVFGGGGEKTVKEILQKVQSHREYCSLIAKNLSQVRPEVIRALIEDLDGFGWEREEDWLAWRGLLIDAACDNVQVLGEVLKRCCGQLCGTSGARAGQVLISLNTLLPCISGQLLSGIQSACPYWKGASCTPESIQLYVLNVLLVVECSPVLQDRLMEFILSSILLPLDLQSLNAVIKEGDDENNPKLAEKFALVAKELGEALQRITTATDRFRDLCFSMIRIFDKHFICAHQPKQSLMIFWSICLLDEVVADRFLGFLLASLYARDAQLSHADPDSNASCLLNNSLQANALMTVSALIADFMVNFPSLSTSQLQLTINLLLEWLERKAEAIEVYREVLCVPKGGYLNPVEVSVCAAVIQATLRVSCRAPEEMHSEISRRVDVLISGQISLSLALIESEVVDEFSAIFTLNSIQSIRNELLSSLNAPRRRRERESLATCTFISDQFSTYRPFFSCGRSDEKMEPATD